MSEHDLQSAYFDWVNIQAITDERYKLIYANVNQNILLSKMPVKQRYYILNYMKKEGLKSGVPDVIIPFHKIINDKIYSNLYIEFKSNKGKLSLFQKAMINRLKKFNNAVCVTNDLDKAINATLIWLEK
jgi:hypothetical protein